MEKDTVTNEKLAWMISKGFTGLGKRGGGGGKNKTHITTLYHLIN